MAQDLFEKYDVDPTAPITNVRDLLMGQDVGTQQQIQRPIQHSLLESLSRSAPIQSILGAGDVLARDLSLGLLHPKFGEGTAYGMGKIGGEIGEFLGLGGAKLLGGLGKLGIKGLSKGASLLKLSPKEAVKDIISVVEDNLAKTTEQSKKIYNPISEQVGESNIYAQKGSKLAAPEQLSQTESKYLKLPEKEVKNIYVSDLKKLHNKFIDNPTFNNAHDLQSELGYELRNLDKMGRRLGALPAAERNLYNSLDYARTSLQNDMSSFLNKVNPELSEQYKLAGQHFVKNVIPNREASLILKNLGKNPNPKSVIKALENAEYKSNKVLPEEIPDLIENLRSSITRSGVAKKIGLGLGIGEAVRLGKDLF